MPDYLNGHPTVEILGSPKTVRLQGTFKGDTYSAPMEVWIMALVAMLSDTQKQQFFDMLKQVQQSSVYKGLQKAQVVADITMPSLF